MKIGFIGFGKMGSALAHGAIDSGFLKASHVCAFDQDVVTQKKMKAKKILSVNTAQAIVDQSDFVFLCVKPQQMADVLSSIKPKKACFVSIAAGIPIKTFERSLGQKTAVVRVMPNTPALLRAGMSVMSAGQWVTPAQISFVQKVLSSVGEAIILPEKKMDAVTALSGSGPAYVFFLAESMIKAATKLGLPKDVAEQLTKQTVYGAGMMLKHTGTSPEALRIQVTSKRGTTEAALKKFKVHHLENIVGQGLQAASKRSLELSRLF